MPFSHPQQYKMIDPQPLFHAKFHSNISLAPPPQRPPDPLFRPSVPLTQSSESPAGVEVGYTPLAPQIHHESILWQRPHDFKTELGWQSWQVSITTHLLPNLSVITRRRLLQKRRRGRSRAPPATGERQHSLTASLRFHARCPRHLPQVFFIRDRGGAASVPPGLAPLPRPLPSLLPCPALRSGCGADKDIQNSLLTGSLHLQ